MAEPPIISNPLRTLHKEDLATGECANPECFADHTGERMFLHPVCHPHAPVHVSFIAGDPKSLMVVCAACDRPVCRMALESKEVPFHDDSPEGFAV